MTDTDSVLVGIILGLAIPLVIEWRSARFWKARADYWFSRATELEGLNTQSRAVWSNTWQHPKGHVVRVYASADQFEASVRALVIARRDARGNAP